MRHLEITAQLVSGCFEVKRVGEKLRITVYERGCL